MEYLHGNAEKRTIIIEAKNLGSANKPILVDDQQFTRLCAMLQNKFEYTAGIGVFFTRFGASGFPNTSRKRVLENAQATQIIFHAKTTKNVVVIDHRDIQQLKQVGALPRILEAKIRAIEEWSGLPLEFNGEWKEIDLPSHLSKYLEDNSQPTSDSN